MFIMTDVSRMFTVFLLWCHIVVSSRRFLYRLFSLWHHKNDPFKNNTNLRNLFPVTIISGCFVSAECEVCSQWRCCCSSPWRSPPRPAERPKITKVRSEIQLTSASSWVWPRSLKASLTFDCDLKLKVCLQTDDTSAAHALETLSWFYNINVQFPQNVEFDFQLYLNFTCNSLT